MAAIGPGSRIVCIDAGTPICNLTVGRCYTVRGVRKGRSRRTNKIGGGVVLHEVMPAPPFHNDSYELTLFRPFDEGDSERLREKLGIDENAKVPAHA